jgi:hypothetical protein
MALTEKENICCGLQKSEDIDMEKLFNIYGEKQKSTPFSYARGQDHEQ